MRRAPLLLLVSLGFAVVGRAEEPKSRADEAKGVAVESKDGKFTATFPAKSKTESSKVKLPDDKEITVTRETVDVGGTAYVIAFNDYPAGVLDPDAQTVLKNVRNGNVGDGKLMTDKDGEFGKQKYPMREITFEKDKLFFRNRMVLVERRLYQVMVVSETEKGLTTPAANKMFDTFTIKK